MCSESGKLQKYQRSRTNLRRNRDTHQTAQIMTDAGMYSGKPPVYPRL